MRRWLKGALVVLVLALGGAAPVVAQSWYDYDSRGGYYPYPARRPMPYNDGYIRSGRDWPRPYDARYGYDGRYGYGDGDGYYGYGARGCTVRHVYYDPDLDRYTVVHRPVPCRDDYYRY